MLVVGDRNDLSAAYVAWLVGNRGVEPRFLAEDRFGLDWSLRSDGEASAVEIEGESLPFDQVSGAFVRFNPRPSVPAEFGIDGIAEGIYAVERRHGLHWLLDRAPFPVVNRPCAGRSNCSKPWQMRALAERGMRVPAWLVTSDPIQAAEFVAACSHGAIYKSCSGLRSRVRRADEELLERLAAGTAPVLIQSYVPGCDARVHVLGEETFATEIRSAGIDYRFDGEETEYRAIECPPEVATLCVDAAAGDGLVLAGLDFRIDPSGAWWCLEMNPVPTFLPYEAGAGHPIGERIVDLLVPGTRAGEARSPLFELAAASGV